MTEVLHFDDGVVISKIVLISLILNIACILPTHTTGQLQDIPYTVPFLKIKYGWAITIVNVATS